MIRFGSLERDYSLSKGDVTLAKGLRGQLGKDVQLHNSLGSIFCKQVFRKCKCVDSCAEPKCFKLTTCDWIRRMLNETT